MRVLKVGLLSSIALVAFGAAFSAEVRGQDPRMIGGGAGITVYEDSNFRGDAATYNSNMSNLPSRFNNRISSIRVGNGETWQVCDQANYRGQCVNVSGEESNLGDNNWNDRISSMRRISGGGWNGGGGGATRPPNWAVGTWYWTNGNRTMVINSNGSVTVNDQGRYSQGTYNNGNINLEGTTSSITRTGNGIRTYNRSSGEVSDYSRSWNGGGWGNVVNAPSWAVGNWRWTNGSGRTMSITSDGRVSVFNRGSGYTYGYFTSQNSFVLEGVTSTVNRDGNRIRTYNQGTGEVSDYRRN